MRRDRTYGEGAFAWGGSLMASAGDAKGHLQCPGRRAHAKASVRDEPGWERVGSACADPDIILFWPRALANNSFTFVCERFFFKWCSISCLCGTWGPLKSQTCGATLGQQICAFWVRTDTHRWKTQVGKIVDSKKKKKAFLIKNGHTAVQKTYVSFQVCEVPLF